LTAAITKVLQKHNPKIVFRSFDSIDNAPEEKARGITIATAHVEYETPNRHYAARRLPGARGLHQEHDHGARRWTGDPGGGGDDGPMPQTREHVLLARQVGVSLHCGGAEQVRCGGRSGAADLVELEVRELLKSYQFPGDDVPVVRLSALLALNGDEKWEKGLTS